MRYSSLFGKTKQSVPSDISLKSHELLFKAGFIRQVAAGRYALLPLGFRVWEKIVAIIDSEMRAIGSNRLLTPTLHPIEIWQKTNRDQAFGEQMLIVDDHHGARFAIGATAEGLMTELIKNEKLSYRDLPAVFHQFSQKFRDEKRPRGGLLRLREFMMKDAYSFHATEEDLLTWYHTFSDAYERIAKKLDLSVVRVEADSGAIGGDFNHEFMVLSPSGEDTIAVCEETGYAANLEKAVSGFTSYPQETELKPLGEFHHDAAVTCAALAEAMGLPLYQTTKTILFIADNSPVAAMIRGDYDINEHKLAKVLGCAQLRLASEAEVKEITGCVPGFVGPIGLPEQVRVIADLTCKDRTNFEVGSNRFGVHLMNVNVERDLPTPEYVDIRTVKEGDSVHAGTGVLTFTRAVEWAHIFHQGQFYAKPQEATYTGQDGKEHIVWQGAYGIGIERTLATVVETHHDDKGMLWPAALAPFQVHAVMLGADSAEVAQTTERLEQLLTEAGWEVLVDDRDASPGVKLKDADLIGIPVRVVISSRSLAAGGVEVTLRDGTFSDVVSLERVAELVSRVYSERA